MVGMATRIRRCEGRCYEIEWINGEKVTEWWIWMARTDKTEPNPISICQSEMGQTNINGGLKKK